MDLFILVLELIGTVAFASSGALAAMEKRMDLFGVNMLGIVTAVGGGTLRDVFSSRTPDIFRKHIYAVASIAGAAAMIGAVRIGGSEGLAMACGVLVVVLIRWMAARFRWNLPRIPERDESAGDAAKGDVPSEK